MSLGHGRGRPARSAGRRHAVARRADLREAHLAMELLAATGQVSSMEVVEVNPIADHQQAAAQTSPVRHLRADGDA